MIKGRRLTDKESQRIILDEIDKAIKLPENFNETIKPFLLSNNKSVSTIPDECKGVELEISTSSKREAIKRWNIQSMPMATSDSHVQNC